MIRIPLLALLPAMLGACVGQQSNAGGGRAMSAADSLVLERTPCYGRCPSYRLRISRAGEVRFHSSNPDPATGVDSIGPDGLYLLEREAERIDFFALPTQIVGSEFCRDSATDHPTVTVEFFGRRRKRVVDYHGCFESFDHSVQTPIAELRKFERVIDSVAGSSRWVRPGRFR